MTKSELSQPLETKVARSTGQAGSGTYAEFMNAFEAFKDANDERLEQIEKRMSADVVTTEKVDRINQALDGYKARLDQMSLKANRLPVDASEQAVNETAMQHKQAFSSYVRKGETAELTSLEAKALSVSSDPDGGYLVPEETETEIGRVLSQASPIRAIADVRQVSASVYKKPFAVSGPATGWVGETAARPETASPALSELQFPTMELYAMPAATQTLLDDAAVNIDQWIADEVRNAFAEQESAAFVNGDGTNMPRGFLNVPQVDDASWSWGSLGYVATGADGAFAAS